MAARNSAVTDPSWLVALLYRADWAQLCLSAEIATRVERPRMVRMKPGEDSWRLADEADEQDPGETWRLATEAGAAAAAGDTDTAAAAGAEGPLPRWREALSRLLIAPGKRYRVEDIEADPPGCETVCDGETRWQITPDEAARQHDQSIQPELAVLLDPSWLIARFDLAITGTAEAAGRPVCKVTATPRPAAPGTAPFPEPRVDYVDVLVDAELGMLLRREAFSDGSSIEFSEVRSLTLDPAEAADPAQFEPPPGLPRTQAWRGSGPLTDTSGPGWRIVKTGAKAAGAALTFAARHTGSHAAPPAATPRLPEPGQPPGPGEAAPLSDHLVNLLHRTGLPAQRFAAGVRKWTDGDLVYRRMAENRATLRWPGVLGPDALWDVIGGWPHETTFETARLQVAMPGRYRIDYLAGGWKERTSACDGERQWTAFPNRVISQPASPLGKDWARLADPAWLLAARWRLSEGGPEDVGGRQGWRIWADAEAGPNPRAQGDASLFGRAAVTVDAELGIVLRLTYLVDGRPAVCFELHDITVPPAGDTGDFQVPPGARVAEGSSPLDLLDIPAPLQAARHAARAGLAGASAIAGWLQKQAGKHDGH
jgi:outer membrane lipoprotein-sorting protein